MPLPRKAQDESNTSEPTVSHKGLSVGALLTLTGVGLLLTLLVVAPFIPALVWALTFAVVAWPMYAMLLARIRRPTIASGITVVVVGLVLVIPTAFLAWQVGHQAADGFEYLRTSVESGGLRDVVTRYPRTAALFNIVGPRVNVERILQSLAPLFQRQAGFWLGAATWATIQILIALFSLFFFLRDRDACLRTARSLLPLSTSEATYFFKQIQAMIHATIYGTVIVAVVQGALGGMMFALLGIPGALLWGTAMAVLSIIPTAGAFVVWLPVAVVYAMQGDWGKATMLAAWGAMVVGTIDNLLYPVLVGKEVRLHTLPIFLSIVGGITLFGAVGIVLGPVVLAATLALIDILKARSA